MSKPETTTKTLDPRDAARIDKALAELAVAMLHLSDEERFDNTLRICALARVKKAVYQLGYFGRNF
ncbi:hypothetical protein KCT17_003679 [Escherichia coli]|nr:hypothetical protein [Escherichia coli]